MAQLHIITPIDPSRSDLKGRADILKKWLESIRAEAPYAYKDIDEVIAVHSYFYLWLKAFTVVGEI